MAQGGNGFIRRISIVGAIVAVASVGSAAIMDFTLTKSRLAQIEEKVRVHDETFREVLKELRLHRDILIRIAVKTGVDLNGKPPVGGVP